MSKDNLYEAVKDRLITAKKAPMSDFTQGCFLGEIDALMACEAITITQGRELILILNLDRAKYKKDIDAWEYSEYESEE